MGVYEPLTKHLKSLPNESWSTSFAEIERILRRPLPQSALEYRPWWANQKGGNHSQSRAWRNAGWETCDVDLKHRTLRFMRVKRDRPDGGSSRVEIKGPRPELWEQAHQISGISDRDELIETALRFLIQREAGRQLAEMGGTMPNIEAVPRRRDIW